MKTILAATCLYFATGPGLFASGEAPPVVVSKEQILAAGQHMAEAQIALFKGNLPKTGWVEGVMWAGFSAFSHVASGAACADAVNAMGAEARWTPPLRPKSPHNADDLVIGQTFLDVYADKKDPTIIEPTQSRLDAASAFIATQEKPGELTWWWCDALFMAPAVHARLSVLTGDAKYLAAMHTEWWRTAGLLYDKDEHLFFRDKRFLGKITKSGKKTFWSRGNGWVFAGLARTIPWIPADDPLRPRYVKMFQEMAAKLASIQQADGTWHPSLLDSAELPFSETSGTALNCFAFAWGINNGLLDAKTYRPVVAGAWAALLAARRPDGVLGHVQDVADRPGAVKADTTKIYATGAFLLSSVELSKLAPLTLPTLSPLTSASP